MIGWLDCSAGAAGDMLLGALVDAGVPLDLLEEAVDAVAPEAVDLWGQRVRRGALTAVRVHVEHTDSSTHRTWADIRDLLAGSRIDSAVRERASTVFARLAEAEGAVHAVPTDEVEFHEVGSLDAIADVVAGCAGLHHLGLATLSASPVAVGAGWVDTAHGRLPVPPPAVVQLLRGVPSSGGPTDGELCTPTGAALLVCWVDAWGPQPAMRVDAVGHGAGSRETPGHANVLRLLLGEPVRRHGPATTSAEPSDDPSIHDRQLLLETNVDDLDPRLWPGVVSRLLAAGAVDAWLTPILMKKGRPAHTLSALVDQVSADAVREVMFVETSAIGMRETPVTKLALRRRTDQVRVGGHDVAVKVAVRGERVVNVQPEWADVARVAEATGKPAKVVLAEAVAAARALWT